MKIRKKATAIGFIAIILWSTLALFTKLTNGIPPFQLLAMSFVIGACINSLTLFKPSNIKDLNSIKKIIRQPLIVWIFVTVGMFLYHLFYFIALDNAPVIEAGLIAYLWPLLIVLMSSLLPNEKLHWFHIVGGIIAFAGATALILLKGNGEIGFSMQYVKGYLFAILAAFTWSSYSVINRRFSSVPSESMAMFCFSVAICGFAAHFISAEQWVTPSNKQWFGILGLGIGPVGIAFLVWDYGTKHGDIQLLGTLAYFAPLISTLLLIFFSDEKYSIGILVGCILIIFGALVAANPFMKKKKSNSGS